MSQTSNGHISAYFKSTWTVLFIGTIAIGPIAFSTGCRTPLHAPGFTGQGLQRGNKNAEPSFDKLLEIERSKPAAKSPSQSSTRRPGREVDVASANLDAGSNNDREVVTASHLDDVPAEQREILARTEAALRNSQTVQPAYASNLDDSKQSTTQASSTRRAQGSLSDSQFQEPADNSEETVTFKFSDAAEPPQPPTKSPASKSQDPKSVAAVFNQNEEKLPPSSRKSKTPTQLTNHESPVRQPSVTDDRNPTDMVAQASATAPESQELAWNEHLRLAIEQLRNDDTSMLGHDEKVRRQLALRLLSLANSDVEAAMEPVESLQPAEQDYYRYQLKALYDSVDPQGNPVSGRRWSLAMLSQRQASDLLSSLSNLEVNNVAFCTEVESFGVVTKFPQNQFKTDQEVLLYCELDNFVSTKLKEGFETQLQGRYEVVDANGRRIADQELPTDTHTCKNRRRDYFIAYRLYIPQNAQPGKHSLKLTIEDMKGHKFGQSTLNFEVVQ